MTKSWLMATAGVLLATGAMAQPNTAPATPAAAAAPTSTTAAPMATSSAAAPMAPGAVQEQLTKGLQGAGYTDVKVVPDGFLAQGTDRQGQPVTLLIGPDSITEVVGAKTVAGGTAPATGGAAAAPQAARPMPNQANGLPAPGALQERLQAHLQATGLTNVRVVPDSFLVEAKDKAGHPVTMVVSPHSITEVVGGMGPNRMAGGTTPAAGDAAGAFTTVVGDDRLSSQIVGLDVYNGDMKDIGTIKDIAYDHGMVKAYIVGVGGFLGMGEHEVAVRPSAVQVTWDGQAKVWHARMNTTVDALKAAPEYKANRSGG